MLIKLGARHLVLELKDRSPAASFCAANALMWKTGARNRAHRDVDEFVLPLRHQKPHLAAPILCLARRGGGDLQGVRRSSGRSGILSLASPTGNDPSPRRDCSGSPPIAAHEARHSYHFVFLPARQGHWGAPPGAERASVAAGRPNSLGSSVMHTPHSLESRRVCGCFCTRRRSALRSGAANTEHLSCGRSR
ncbi:hypothetical protein BD413DRAFT_47403 [Trametes elegans]|nr:hypothetical protein BD413DRAFT_47403 [Trametes elegans]